MALVLHVRSCGGGGYSTVVTELDRERTLISEELKANLCLDKWNVSGDGVIRGTVDIERTDIPSPSSYYGIRVQLNGVGHVTIKNHKSLPKYYYSYNRRKTVRMVKSNQEHGKLPGDFVSSIYVDIIYENEPLRNQFLSYGGTYNKCSVYFEICIPVEERILSSSTEIGEMEYTVEVLATRSGAKGRHIKLIQKYVNMFGFTCLSNICTNYNEPMINTYKVSYLNNANVTLIANKQGFVPGEVLSFMMTIEHLKKFLPIKQITLELQRSAIFELKSEIVVLKAYAFKEDQIKVENNVATISGEYKIGNDLYPTFSPSFSLPTGKYAIRYYIEFQISSEGHNFKRRHQIFIGSLKSVASYPPLYMSTPNIIEDECRSETASTIPERTRSWSIQKLFKRLSLAFVPY